MTTHRCNHPTKTGKPCQNLVYGSDDWFSDPMKILDKSLSLPCPIHTTPTYQKFSDAFHRAYEIGQYDQQQRSQHRIDVLENEINNLKDKIIKLEEIQRMSDPNFQTHLPNGDQIVVVEGYSYAWKASKEPLQVGEDVVVPSGGVRAMISSLPRTYTGTVTALGSSYIGNLTYVLKRV